MTKNSVRVLFTGDDNEKLAKWFYENIKHSGFYRAAELDAEHEDAVLVELNQYDRMSQAQYIFTLLGQTREYRFVGPKCPHYHDAKHNKARRFMVSANFMGLGVETVCMDCRTKMPASFYSTFIDEKEFHMMLLLETASKVRPMPSPKATVQMEASPPTTITGRTSYNTPSDRYPPMSKSEKNKISQELLGVNYEAAELATLFHTLGIRHTVDVKILAEMEHATFEGGEWLDQGDGAVLLISPNDNSLKARNVVTGWMKRNQSSERYCLALVEVDKQNLNGDIFSREAVQKAATAFSQHQAVRVNRTAFKKQSFSLDPDDIRKLSDVTEEDAKKLIEQYYKAWPGLKNWHQMSELTRLTAENDRLREELKESDEALSKSNTELDEYRDAAKRSGKEEEMSDSEAEDIVANQPVVKAADAFLRFMASVNMQDHPVQEQREFNAKFKTLMDELMRLGIGSTPGKQHVGKGQC